MDSYRSHTLTDLILGPRVGRPRTGWGQSDDSVRDHDVAVGVSAELCQLSPKQCADGTRDAP